MGKYSSLAADIIKNVGGKENVESLRHCVTRLRFRLIDESIANDEVIKNMDGVVTVMKAMGEYMVVIGEHVADVYDEVCSQLGLDAMQAENKEQKNAKKKSPLEKVLGTIMGGDGTDSSSALCLRYYQRAVSPSDICRSQTDRWNLYADECSRRLFLLFPAADSWI